MAKIEKQLDQAVTLHRAGNLDAASRLYDAILKAAPKNPAALYFKGMLCHQYGHQAQALAYLTKASAINASNPDVWNLLGVVQRALGQLDAATHSLERAVAISPKAVDALGNLGCVYQDTGKLHAALSCFEKILAVDPKSVEALMMLGSVLQELQQFPQADACFKQALAISPRRAEVHFNYGILLHAWGQPKKSLLAFWSALRLVPEAADQVLSQIELVLGIRTRAETYQLLGGALLDERQYTEAVLAFEKALGLCPDSAEIMDRLGVALMNVGKLEDAERYLNRALTTNPGLALAWNDLGTLCVTLGRAEAGCDAFLKAIQLKPGYAEAFHNLALMYEREGELDKSVEHFEKTLELEPSYALAHSNYAGALLRRGEWEKAWLEFEWRISKKRSNFVEVPLYIDHPDDSGRVLPLPSKLLPIDYQGKRILLMHDQGIGDEIFYLRFVRKLKSKGAHVSYVASPKLIEILKGADDIDALYASFPKGDIFDYIFLVTDLPLITGMKSDEDIPPPLTIKPDAQKVDEIKNMLAAHGPGPYLGVTWRAGTRGNIYNNRSLFKEIPLEFLANQIRDWPGSAIVLQRLPDEGEITRFESLTGNRAIDMTALNDDLPAMLALLSVLDEYVGVSNANMHLRASLGLTAKVWVPWPPEWRWGMSGDQSKWFPGFHVYRESKGSGWQVS